VPLQKWLWQLSGAAPVVHDEAATADKEVADKRAAEEAALKRAAEEPAAKKAVEERATEEAAMKAGAVSGRGQEVCGSKWLHPVGQTSLQGCLETSVCPALSPFFPFFIPLLPFYSGPLPPARSP
jgi:hypothetical protein